MAEYFNHMEAITAAVWGYDILLIQVIIVAAVIKAVVVLVLVVVALVGVGSGKIAEKPWSLIR